MKKKFKKFIALSLCICMMAAMSISASAATNPIMRGSPENAVHWRNMGNTSGYLNAYANTPSDVVNGTKVTQYTYNNDATQKFYTQTGYLKNASRTDLVVKETNDPYSMDQIVTLASNTSGAQLSFNSESNGIVISQASTGYVLIGNVYNNTSSTVSFGARTSSLGNYIYWKLS